MARTPPQVERLTQALAKYLGGHVKLEFVDGAPPVETPAQHGERRSAEALDAARRALEEDPDGARNEIAFRRHAASRVGAANGIEEERAMRGGGNMMKQAMALQANMKKAQDEIANMEVTGESGGGMVKVTMNGKHEVKRVQIEPQVASEDREMLEDLIAAAINDAVNKVDQQTQARMSS